MGRTLKFEIPRAFSPLLKPARYKGAHGGRGSGKCLGRNMRIMMFDGSVKAVQDIRQDDVLLGPDSLARTVLGITQADGPLYLVKQPNAMGYVVNDAHILVMTDDQQQSLRVSASQFHSAYWAYDGVLYNNCQGVQLHQQQLVPTGKLTIESIGHGDYYGFQLNGDSLFLLEDGTVTHNSHFFGEALIKRCLEKPTRAVCVREVQRSLEQSVKRLLEDKIEGLQLQDQFEVTHTHINTPGGGIITFVGMQNHTAESVKSLEGFHVAWVEEAQSLSQRSLDLLRPTIREENSELWFSWNPRSEKDPIDKLLRNPLGAPPKSIVVEANYRNNPKFPAVLRDEMEWDRKRDPEKYEHIWLGGYERNSEARVFKNWRVESFDTPEDTVFYYGADWGFSVDPTVLVRLWLRKRDGMRPELMIDREVYRIGCEIDHIPALFDQIEGARDWPIVADSARPETISYLQRNGYPKMEAARKGANSVKEGVIFLQGYDIVIHERCTHAHDEFVSYAYKRDPLTNLVTPYLSEKKNHVLDSCRYACEKLQDIVVEEWITW